MTDDSVTMSGSLSSDDGGDRRRRSDARRFAALVIITAATFIAAGHTLRQPTFMTANDISRWCTVWSLLERGTYVIDECPWQIDTQDKVYARAQERSGQTGGQEPVKHYYSSKPALLLDPDRGDALPGAADHAASRSTGSSSRSGPSAGPRSPTPTTRASSWACSRRPRTP